MALSHLTTRHSKMLCGLFLGSAMALCGHAAAHDAAHSNDDQPRNDDHNHTSLIDEAVITTIESMQPVTGEENLNVVMPFADIPTMGDARIKRLIETLRSTPIGREMYDYAAGQGTAIQWEVENDKRVGSFIHDKNVITLEARASDDAITLTLVHEIRHAWQFRTLNVNDWELSPRDRWNAARLIETDSCAYTVHFVADYNKQTGKTLDAKLNYNRLIVEEYREKPEDQRDYIKDAVEPCFRKVESYYNDMHLQMVTHYFKQNQIVYDRVENSNNRRKLNNAYDRGFDTPSNEGRATLFKKFFIMSVTKDDNAAPMPQIDAMESSLFLDWITAQAPVTRTEDNAEIARMDAEFYAMRLNLLRGDDNISARRREPNPEP